MTKTERPAEGPVERRPMLDIQGLTKTFKLRSGTSTHRFVAVDDVSLRVDQGRITALVGESGSGKSTLARCALRLVEPDEGSVFIDGVDFGRLRGRALRSFRKKAQMIFQDPTASLNGRLTVGALVKEPLVIHGLVGAKDMAERVASLLESVGLSREMAARYPHDLSGGQRQRVVIARALALEPSLIIADEPVSALDVSVAAQIINLLLDLKRDRGLTYLFISHDLTMVRRIADDVVIMLAGRVVERGPTERIFAETAHPYTKELLAAVPTLEGTIGTRGTKSEPVRPTDERRGCPFAGRCPRVMEVCKSQAPPLVAADEGHHAACFLFVTK